MNIIRFPMTEHNNTEEMLWLELEIAERRVEDIKRALGILTVEKGIEG